MIPARTRTLPCTMPPKHSTTNQSESDSPRVRTKPASPSLIPLVLLVFLVLLVLPVLRDFLYPSYRVRAARPRVLARSLSPFASSTPALGTDGDPYPQAVTRAGPARCDVRETIRTTTRLAASTASVLVSHVHTITSQKSAVLQICSPSRPRPSPFFLTFTTATSVVSRRLRRLRRLHNVKVSMAPTAPTA